MFDLLPNQFVILFAFLTQDALVKQSSSLSVDDQMPMCSGLFIDGLKVLKNTEPDISLDYVQTVANVRYALMVVADFLHRQHLKVSQPDEYIEVFSGLILF